MCFISNELNGSVNVPALSSRTARGFFTLHLKSWIQLVVPNEAARAVRAAMMNSSTVFQTLGFLTFIILRSLRV